MTVMAIGQQALQISSVNKTVEAQAESVNNQLQHEYQQAAYDHREQAEAALDEGYRSEVEKRQAVGKAAVKNAALGIRGTTAAETLAEELQVGNYNVATAKDRRSNADTAYRLGTGQSFAGATNQVKTIKAQSPSMFESILSMGAAGLGGYMSGMQYNKSMSGVPDSVKR